MTIWFGLALLIVASLAITLLSERMGQQSIGAYLLFGFTSTMWLNVFLPHIPSALIYRGYTPGLVTAVLINLPVMTLLISRALRERWVSGTKAFGYALLTPLALGCAIFFLFSLA
jgi:hypothetical protein